MKRQGANVDTYAWQGLILRAKAWSLMGVSRSTALRHEADDPEWPKPVKLSTRRLAYKAEGVKRWIDSRPEAAPNRAETAPAVAAHQRNVAARNRQSAGDLVERKAAA